MNIETAPSADEERECPICSTDGSYVEYGGDLVCLNCAHTPTPETTRSQDANPWGQWHKHRRDEYDGFYGEERVRMIGGFAATYDFGPDFLATEP